MGRVKKYGQYVCVEGSKLDKGEEMSQKRVKGEGENGSYVDSQGWILFEKKGYREGGIQIEEGMKKGGERSEVIVEDWGDMYYM